MRQLRDKTVRRLSLVFPGEWVHTGPVSVQRESNTSGGSDMRRRLSLSVFLCLAVSWVLGTMQPAQGQALYGSIVGNVKDSSEAVVAGVSVTLTNLETKQSREITTSETGTYSFPPGSPR